MRTLVLGGAGFAGVAACKELMRRGVETIAAGRTDQPYGTFTSFERVDRSDHDALAELLAGREPDVVVDLAQPTQVEADWLADAFAGRHVVLACREGEPISAGGRRVVVRSGPIVGGGDRSGGLDQLAAALEGGRQVDPAQELAGLSWVRDVGFALALAADLGRAVEGRVFEIGFPGAPEVDLEPALSELGWRASAPEDCLAEVLAYYRSSRRR